MNKPLAGVAVLAACGVMAWAQPEQPEKAPGAPERPAQQQPPGQEQDRKLAMTLESDSIKHDTQMPRRHTIDGEEGKGRDISPHLKWGKVPEGTKEFALVMFDPDARGFVHWVVYNIPADVTELPEGLPAGKENAVLEKPVRVTQGLNDFRQIGYRGPAARRGGGVHRYRFRIYALDTELRLEPGATRRQLDEAMKGHILAEGELIGRNER